MATLNSDGSFQFANVVPGRYSIEVTSPAWFLIAGGMGSESLLDGPFEIADDGRAQLSLTFSKRPARVVGTLQVPAHQTPSSYTVVIFPSETAHRRASSLRVRTTAVGSDGSFVVGNLPPGGYLVGVATTEDIDELRDPRFLDQLAPLALPMALALGDEKTLTLKVPGEGR